MLKDFYLLYAAADMQRKREKHRYAEKLQENETTPPFQVVETMPVHSVISP